MSSKKGEKMPSQPKQGDKRVRKEAEDGDTMAKPKKRGPKQHWTLTEILALERAKTKLALLQTATIAKEPGLQNRVTWQINKRLRGDAKDIEKKNGGDPTWVDKFRVEGSKNERQ